MRLLGRYINPSVQELTADLQHEDGKVRRTALSELMKMGPRAKDAAPALFDRLADHDAGVRVYAAWLLSRLAPESKAVPSLVRMLDDEEDVVREGVTMALAHAVWPRTRTGGHKHGINELLMHIYALYNADVNIRIQAATALRKKELGMGAVYALIGALRLKEGGVVAAYTLGDIGPRAEAAIPFLNKLLKDDDPHKRLAARDAIKGIRQEGAEEAAVTRRPTRKGRKSQQTGTGDEEEGTTIEIIFNCSEYPYDEHSEVVGEALWNAINGTGLGDVLGDAAGRETWDTTIVVPAVEKGLEAIRTTLSELGCPPSTEIRVANRPPECISVKRAAKKAPARIPKKQGSLKVVEEKQTEVQTEAKECAKCGRRIGKGPRMPLIEAGNLASAVPIIDDILAREAYRCERCRCVICQGCVILGRPQLCPNCGQQMV